MNFFSSFFRSPEEELKFQIDQLRKKINFADRDKQRFLNSPSNKGRTRQQLEYEYNTDHAHSIPALEADRQRLEDLEIQLEELQKRNNTDRWWDTRIEPISRTGGKIGKMKSKSKKNIKIKKMKNKSQRRLKKRIRY